MGYIEGQKSEEWFRNLLVENNLNYEHQDIWYDFLVEKERVELKSCKLYVKKGDDKWQNGRFKFTDASTRDTQYDENIWVAFIVRWKQQNIFLGFVEAQKLNKASDILIKTVVQLEPLTMEEWIKKIRK